ncbi:MAG: hypothetical protein AAGI49_13390 [Bacteroidota bacterium]
MKNAARIEKYLNRAMSREEAQQLEVELKADESLMEELKLQRLMRFSIQMNRKEELRQKLKQAQEKSSKTNKITPTKRSFFNKPIQILAIAASFTLLLLAGYFLLRQQDRNTVIADANYTFDILNVRGETAQEKLLDDGIDALEASNYAEAIELLKQVKYDPIRARYLIGHAHYQAGDYQAAKSDFEAVFSQGAAAGDYKSEAEWYWLLTKLQLDELDDQFETRLNQAKGKRVQVLTKQLNTFWR